MSTCSTSLTTKEMQIHTMVREYDILTRTTELKRGELKSSDHINTNKTLSYVSGRNIMWSKHSGK